MRLTRPDPDAQGARRRLQRCRGAAVEPETQPDHIALQLGQAVDGRVELAERERAGDLVFEGGLATAHHVAESGGGVARQGLVEAGHDPRQPDVIGVGFELGRERVLGQADGTALRLHGTLQRLADPPGGVGGETEPLAPVELLDGAHQAEGPLLDEVDHVDATSLVPARPVNDKAQVGPDHLLAGFLVPLLDPLGELGLFGGAQQRESAEIVEEQPHQVGPCGIGFAHDTTPLSSGQLRRGGVFDLVLG